MRGALKYEIFCCHGNISRLKPALIKNTITSFSSRDSRDTMGFLGGGGGALYDLTLRDNIFLISHRTETRRAR